MELHASLHRSCIRGCARPAADPALFCVNCRALLHTLVRCAPDLMGRLIGLTDPNRATPTDRERFSPARRGSSLPVDADLFDATNDLRHTLDKWARVTHPRQLAAVLDDLMTSHDHAAQLSKDFLTRSILVDGVREFWSVADAMSKWGLERHTPQQPHTDADSPSETPTTPVPIAEWGDQLVNREAAAAIVGSLRTLQRWQKKGWISPAGSIYVAGRHTTLYRRSELTLVLQRMHPKRSHPIEPSIR